MRKRLFDEQTRVCLISQWYAPEPTSVPVLTAHELQRSDYSVHVLTGIPNRPDGIVHKGYRAWRTQRECRDGIQLTRTPLYPNHSPSVPKRMLNYLSWALSVSLFGINRLREADVNVVHCTPATSALPALIAKRVFGVPYVVIIQDLWPDTVTASGFLKSGRVTQLVVKALDRFVAQLYGGAERVIVISPGMAETLEQRGIPRSRIDVVFNSVDESIYRPRPRDLSMREQLGVERSDFVLFYAGNQGAAQDLSTLIRAVGLAAEEAHVKLVMAGWGVQHDSLIELAESVAPGRVRFLGRIRPAEVRRAQSAADLCVVALKDDPLFRITMPSKLQSLLAAGVPILGVVAGDPARVISTARAGVVAEPGNVLSVLSAINSAAEVGLEERGDWGRNGHAYYAEIMASVVRSQKLRDVVEEVISTPMLRAVLRRGVRPADCRERA